MEVLAPSPQTTLLILLGASTWPLSPEFQASQAFANAAQRVKAYFLNPRSFGLPDENLLDLFDADNSADELDVAIGQFLEQRLAAMKRAGKGGRDLLLYFIGHGGFVGYDSDFYLAIRRTRMDSPRASGMQMMSLADTLTGRARHLRRILILDCCFAAAAFSAFQAGPDQVALQKTKDAFEVRQKTVGFPTKGTTLLCSSNQKSPSLIMPDGSSTMFTKAFLDALVHGSPLQRDQLTLRDVKDRATDFLSEIRNAPKPVVHSPDQSDGDVADIPFFPNPRFEEERLHLPVETPAPLSSPQEVPAAQMPHQQSKGLSDVGKLASAWSIGGQQILAMIVSTALFAFVNYPLGLFNQMAFGGSSSPSESQSVQLAIVWGLSLIIPSISAAKFGPWVGLVSATFGLLLGNVFSGTFTNFIIAPWYGYITTAIFGFIAGLAFVRTRGHYTTRGALLSLVVINIVGLITSLIWDGIAASIFYPSSLSFLFTNFYLPTTLIFCLPGLLLLVCGLIVYERGTHRKS
jgi:hypothetical protein